MSPKTDAGAVPGPLQFSDPRAVAVLDPAPAELSYAGPVAVVVDSGNFRLTLIFVCNGELLRHIPLNGRQQERTEPQSVAVTPASEIVELSFGSGYINVFTVTGTLVCVLNLDTVNARGLAVCPSSGLVWTADCASGWTTFKFELLRDLVALRRGAVPIVEHIPEYDACVDTRYFPLDKLKGGLLGEMTFTKHGCLWVVDYSCSRLYMFR